MNELRYYDLGYSEVFIFENYLINQIKEGEIVTVDHAQVLKAMIDKHFSNRKMIYIGNRVNSYSVNPLVYLKVAEIDNLLGIGIVVNSDIKENTANYEKQFSAKPFEIFEKMNDAILWATEQISLQA
ncbi:hypothetical protein CW736_06900 [Nonlabens sp. MB-3u-79]|jgi:hypothetical protein|uniref:hypothetical protein n=1 Tax=Nonlabens sp. MB-3u-79 TaxID=2058134 RepID=UPI000C317A7B|nr:hypothetical protein [Nonlabens sp. MB-3u-79]AUC79122.1 hypothetical protein CW736_06900 [Nonlabens sp. MB-3u-79]|tara:strand:+ start:18394 stop:18774 length:381 start_codon:yes stop_codon:yes gene_type:complete